MELTLKVQRVELGMGNDKYINASNLDEEVLHVKHVMVDFNKP